MKRTRRKKGKTHNTKRYVPITYSKKKEKRLKEADNNRKKKC